MGGILYDESAFRKIATSLPSQCEAFAAVLYHENRRAAKEGHPEDIQPGSRPEAATLGPSIPKMCRMKRRVKSVVRPARLRELKEGAYNSNLPRKRKIGVEGDVAHLVLDSQPPDTIVQPLRLPALKAARKIRRRKVPSFHTANGRCFSLLSRMKPCARPYGRDSKCTFRTSVSVGRITLNSAWPFRSGDGS